MQKNGFTLAELLGVLVIISLVGVITVPVIIDTLSSYKRNICHNQLEQIKAAGRAWATDNMYLLPTEDTETHSVTLLELSSGGYIDKNIKNPVTGEYFNGSTTSVTITRDKKRYTYTVVYDNSCDS